METEALVKPRSRAPSPRSKSLSPSSSDDEARNLPPTEKRTQRGHEWFTYFRGEQERYVFPKIIAKINKENPKLIKIPKFVYNRVQKIGNSDIIIYKKTSRDTFNIINTDDILILNDGHAVYNKVASPLNREIIMVRASYTPFIERDNSSGVNEFNKEFIVYGSEIIGVIKHTDTTVYNNWKNIISLYSTTEGGRRKRVSKCCITFFYNDKKYTRYIYKDKNGNKYVKFNGKNIKV